MTTPADDDAGTLDAAVRELVESTTGDAQHDVPLYRRAHELIRASLEDNAQH